MRRLLPALVFALFTSSCGNDSTERLEYIAFTMTQAFEGRDYELAKKVCHPDLLASDEAAVRAYVDKVASQLGGERAEWEITKTSLQNRTGMLNLGLRTPKAETGTILGLEKHDGQWYVRSVP